MLFEMPRIGAAILRHLGGYVEMFEAEASGALQSIRQRAVLAALALGSGLISVLMALLWIIAATWEGPYRLLVIGSLCAVFGFVAVTAVAGASRERDPVFGRLRSEWNADRSLLFGRVYSADDGDEGDERA